MSEIKSLSIVQLLLEVFTLAIKVFILSRRLSLKTVEGG